MHIVNPGSSGVGSKLLTSVRVPQLTQSSYAATYNATDGSGTDVNMTPLTLTCTPSSSNSSVMLEWTIFGEGSDYSIGFFIKKDGTTLSGSTDGTNGWSTTTVAGYDASYVNSPTPTVIRFEDTAPVGGVSAAYSLWVRATRAGSQTWYLNRCVGSAGASSYPTGISTGTATEYYA